MKQARWVPMGIPLLWDQGATTAAADDHILFAPESEGCNPWQVVQNHPVPGELYSTRSARASLSSHSSLLTLLCSFQELVPAQGPFTFSSNVSLPISLSTTSKRRRNYNGLFILNIDSSLSTPQATISLDVRASSVELRDRVHACLNSTFGEGSGLSIYVS
jgi:hypothetical protein